MTKKILLDTDIGSDIDDAVCLAYLLANPDFELMGVTTVTGESDKRAMLASALCRVAGKKVPVYPGSELPLLIEQHQKHAPQAEALSRWDHQSTFPEGQAVYFLQDLIHAYPGEITLLTIGPLTNIAQLFSIDPQAPFLIKEIISMNGIFSNKIPGVGPLEWNAMGDPHATALVYNRTKKNHKVLGLDITCQIVMEKKHAQKHFKNELLDVVMDFAQSHFERYSYITFHDPLTAVVAMNDTVCSFDRGKIDIELHSPRLTGFTHWCNDSDGPHAVAVQVNPECFYKSFFSVF